MPPEVPSGPRSIQDQLTADHERLSTLFRQIDDALADSMVDADSLFAELSRGLERHILWEEDRLFVALEALADARGRKHLESLRLDHVRIRDSLKSVETEIARGDPVAARAYMEDLRIFLAGHNDDEELGAYRDADRLLSEKARVSLLREWENFQGE